MAAPAPLETALRHDRMVVGVTLAAVIVVAWVWLADQALEMEAMTMATLSPWSMADAWTTFAMWTVMMIGMMLPSAAPMILLYALVARKRGSPSRDFAHIGIFTGGYLIAWTLFSIAATALQWGFEQTALLSPMMASASPYFGGGLLIAAGIYQLTPLKQACLNNCRSPIDFLSRSWRPGKAGAVIMGVHHGVYCVGCCWALMALLFLLGVMNLLWVAALAAFVLLEKIASYGNVLGRAAGVLMTLAGVMMMTQG